MVDRSGIVCYSISGEQTNSHTKMPKNITEIGTCNFLSAAAAKRWYSQTRLLDGLTELGKNKEIQRKIQDGEIALGPPFCQPHQTLRIIEGRYRIREEREIPPPPTEDPSHGPL